MIKVLIIILALATATFCIPQHLSALTAEQETAVVAGMFDSMENQTPDKQREIMRQIVLFPASDATRQQVIAPALASMALKIDQEESLRRESLKAIVTITKDKRLNQPYVLLLQKNTITVDSVVEAATFAKDERFVSAIREVAIDPEADFRLRETAVRSFLELWPAQQCDEVLQEFTTTKAPANPALTPLKKEPTSTKTTESMRTLLNIAAATNTKATTSQRLKAQLVLGCLGNHTIIRQLLNRFPSELVEQRSVLAGFFGWFHDKQTIPAVGDCSRNDPSKTVRTNCLASLVELSKVAETSEASMLQLQRSYNEIRNERERRLVASLILTTPEGKSTISYLARRERNKKMRLYLNSLLTNANNPIKNTPHSPFGDTKPPQMP